MEGLKRKTVLLVTHQVDFLPAFDSVLVIHPLKNVPRFLIIYTIILEIGPLMQYSY